MKEQVKVMLPTDLIAAIGQMGLSRIMRGKCYKLSNIILYKTFFKTKDIDGYIVLSSTYLEKVFDKNYHKFFKKMKEQKIFLTSDFYTIGQAKQYRINPEFINDEFAEVVYNEITEKSERINLKPCNEQDKSVKNQTADSNSNLSPGASIMSSPISHSNSYPIFSSQSSILSSIYTPSHYIPHVFDKSCVYDDLGALKYDIDKLKEAAISSVAIISPHNFRINEQVKRKSFKVINKLTGTTYYTSKEKAIDWCDKYDCDIIEDDGRYYMENLNDFLSTKKWFKICSYQWQISKLENRHYYAHRNETNNRLDHNLTSMPKFFLDIVKRDNDLVEIDIKNSQFAFHAYWMKETGWLQYEDVNTYYDLAVKGKLYEELAGIFNVTREEAKELMMELAFSSHKHSSALKKRFREAFPNVLRHIEEFKGNAGSSKMFSIELQKRESELIIDHIYSRIKSEGILCLTRHDSLLVRRDEFEVALRVLKECCTERDFECAVNAEDESVFICESQMDNEDNILAWLDEHEARQNDLRKEKEFYKQLYPNRLI